MNERSAGVLLQTVFGIMFAKVETERLAEDAAINTVKLPAAWSGQWV